MLEWICFSARYQWCFHFGRDTVLATVDGLALLANLACDGGRMLHTSSVGDALFDRAGGLADMLPPTGPLREIVFVMRFPVNVRRVPFAFFAVAVVR